MSIAAGMVGLSACVNTRVFSETELGRVALACGVAMGEVIQEPDHPQYLFLYAVQPSRAQLGCVRRWSRRRNMHLAFIEAIDWAEDPNATQN